MKKLFTAAALAAAMILPQCSEAQMAGNLYLNNSKLDSLYSDNGESKIAIRSFFESAGYTVLWNKVHNCAVVFNSERIITMYVGTNVMFLDQIGFFLDDNITYIDGSLVMPIDAAEKALDASIEYNGTDIYITSAKTRDSAGWQYEILSLTNAERKKAGLGALIWNASLAQAASEHTKDMISRGYFSHSTPEGLSPFDRIKQLGVSYTYAAENLAAGQPDPQSVFDAWMNSDDHRKNILNPNVREMGAAFSRGGEYGIYWAQEFATTF